MIFCDKDAYYHDDKDWNRVKHNFTTDTVRQIHSFHENMWGSSNSVEGLGTELASEKLSV